MKIGFVRVLGEDRYDYHTADQNVGLGYLAAVSALHNVSSDIYDPLDPKEFNNSAILNSKYDIVGFTVHYLNIVETLEIARALKLKFPSTVIMLGGHHASATAQEILEDHWYVDAVCVGEGEDVIQRVILMLKGGSDAKDIREIGIFAPEEYESLDHLPFPIREVVSPVSRISTSRGCPYHCTFCTTPGIRGITDEPTYRVRTTDNVLAEVEMLCSRGVRKIYINDDSYILPSPKSRSRAMDIANGLQGKKINVEYKAQFRIDSFSLQDFRVLKALRASGLRSVFLGIESGSNRILEEYDKRITVEQCIDTLNMYHRAGIQVNAGNILASPESTLAEIRDSIKGFQKMGIAFMFFRRVTFRAHVFPGTLLEQRLQSENRLDKKPRYLPRDYTFLDPRIGEVVDIFERAMPSFLQDVGTELFRLRSDALGLYYRSRNKHAMQELLCILSEWNHKCADLLLAWFSPSKSKNSTKIAFEYDFMWETRTRLAAFVKKWSRDIESV